jgi:hypothetical protein
MVKVRPAAVMVPVRLEELGLAETAYTSVPAPVPLAPLESVIQLAVVVEVLADWHPDGVAPIAMAPVPPSAVKLWLEGEMLNVQGLPCWVTVNVRPATVSDPVLASGPVLAATVYPTLPAPFPVAPKLIVIHDVEVDAVRGVVHPAGVALMVTRPVPPVAVNS